MISRIFLTMGGMLSSPWRETRSFEEEAKALRTELGNYRTTDLKITIVGQSGVGKSSLINSIFSLSKGRIANKTSVKSGTKPGVGTHYFTGIKAMEDDLFQCISIFDTMGFAFSEEYGISMDQLKACLEGRIDVGHKFNEDEALSEGTNSNRPHCVLLVMSAMELDTYEPTHRRHEKLREVNNLIPEDVAKIVVITSIDVVCPYSKNDFKFIYKSRKVLTLVKNAQAILGVPENYVFPIINFLNEMTVNNERCVPIMFLLKFAFGFAKDRQEIDTN